LASENGRIEIIKLLLKDSRVNPASGKNLSLRDASENGKFEIVKLLLNDPRVDPSDFDNDAIWYAHSNRHIDILKLLWKNIKVKNTLQKDNPKLHKELTQQDIKNKIEQF
jgi:hypothetical protein